MQLYTKDPDAKSVLKQKWVLACIARAVIPAFAKYTVQQIIDQCMTVYWQEDVPLDGQETVLLLQQESIAAEGIVVFDLLTELFDPATGMRYRIDLESENWTSGIKLINRQDYYMSRLISGQKNDVFRNHDYEDIIPVWAIWICFNQKGKTGVDIWQSGRNSNCATIYLGNAILETEKAGPVQDMCIALQTAFSSQLTWKEKKDRIEAVLQIKLSEEEIDMMIKEDPWAAFIREEGREEGIQIGQRKGIEEGRGDNERSMVQTMLQKRILTPEEIASVFSIPLERVRKIQESL